MRRIYRIEDADGQGPYQQSLDIPQFASSVHPMPYTEDALDWNKLPDKDSWHCGFESIEQLNRWFYEHEWLENMHNAGLRLTVWEVPESLYRISQTQAVFYRSYSTKVDEQPLIH